MSQFPYKAVLFDMDGTTVDTDMMVVLTYYRMFRHFLPKQKPSLKKLMYFSGPPLKDVLPVEFPNVPYEEALDFFRKTAHQYYELTVTAYPGVKDVILSLKQKGILTGVVTGKLHAETELTLKLTGLEGLFSFLICGDDLKKCKPDPEGLNKALMELGGLSPKDVLYIGDTKYDYLSAKAAHMDCMLATWTPRQLPQDVHPAYYLDDWKDFYGTIEHGKVN